MFRKSEQQKQAILAAFDRTILDPCVKYKKVNNFLVLVLTMDMLRSFFTGVPFIDDPSNKNNNSNDNLV